MREFQLPNEGALLDAFVEDGGSRGTARGRKAPRGGKPPRKRRSVLVRAFYSVAVLGLCCCCMGVAFRACSLLLVQKRRPPGWQPVARCPRPAARFDEPSMARRPRTAAVASPDDEYYMRSQRRFEPRVARDPWRRRCSRIGGN